MDGVDVSPPPIFHLSIPVWDLAQSADFYRAVLGATIGRRTEMFVDVLVMGAQITLQHDPASVSSPMPRTRHFGWTLPWAEWELLAAGLESHAIVVEPPTMSYPGEQREQAKVMITDPSGNLIELKAYRHPDAVLGRLAERRARF
jgi:hypothetical protein